ncbi:integrase/recombinase [Mycobacteroides abscessus 5S-0422]|nr:serine recombinase [Mycobacteroides abscessus]EIU12365.1 integrase/recombinase [Mycobacteroides abscessus 5S-0304]EIU15032.1 integrase/recombinase [Mycobacteroides abscessus 5S-0422]EIU26932.1 integrase/recombinase [Mycobacteroides abscessus 5S-0708]EIU27216.1 integrase/recombinase [Mycobacteroides abscessus 5S-0817]EIU30661.1 integrase/recombinase [Mycobacteroides abscessus 5S-1212]EIU92717.1 integrase/recombinase [Mycobacteroides abscessus 5S-0921]QBE80418.1 recombinase family protein [
MRSAAIYARISADAEGTGLGVTRQLEDCRKLATDRGWPVGDEYVDNDVSAYSGKPRREYARMLEDLKSGTRDAVIVYNLDRLHRRPVELEDFVILCESVGVRDVATVTADIDLGNDDGLFMARIFAAFAAKESGRKSARIRRKMLQNAEQGLPHGPARPFGYENDKITLRPDEARIVREMVDRYLAGASIRSLTIWLNDTGVAPATSKSWQTTTVRHILASGRIAGLREHHGQVVGRGAWPAIITPAERDRILARIATRSLTKTRAPRTYLLSGMLRCGRCGNRLFSQARHNNPTNRVRRYVCLKGPDHGGCGRLTVVALPVEELLTDAVLTRLDSPQLAEALAGKSRVDADVATLAAQLEADQTRLDELAGLYAQGAVSAREWIAARDPITDRITRARRDIATATDTSAVVDLAGRGDLLRSQWDDLDIGRQQAIIKSVLDHAVIAPGTPGTRKLDINRVQPHWRT